MVMEIGPAEWYGAFRREVRDTRWSDPLRESALQGRLGDWTKHLTGAVVATCRNLGWTAVARGYPAKVGTERTLPPLPVSREEYLAMDVMAFPQADRPGWSKPVAVFELENRLSEAISYSLWKVSMVRSFWGGVFCYRKRPEKIGDLLNDLTQGIMADMHPDEVHILLVVGTRSKAEFPDGFFRPYLWDRTFRQFRLLLEGRR